MIIFTNIIELNYFVNQTEIAGYSKAYLLWGNSVYKITF